LLYTGGFDTVTEEQAASQFYPYNESLILVVVFGLEKQYDEGEFPLIQPLWMRDRKGKNNSTLGGVPMKRFMYFTVFMLMVLVTACGGSQAVATEEAPAPTNTLEQPTMTMTPMPTDTPTAEPTATPDAAATVAAQSTQAAGEVFSELDKLLSDSEVPYKDGHLAWQQTEPIAINMQGPSGDVASIQEIDENLTAGNFVFKSDVTWNATGWMYCGAVFRSEANIKIGKQYQFYFLRFSGLPIWYLDVFDNGSDYLGSISNEQSARVIDVTNGAVNQFVVVAEDEKFTVYFNGERQGRFFDNSKQRMEGSFGFFAWQESGTGSCEYENSWIWSLDQ
jgi:hypothetical protein